MLEIIWDQQYNIRGIQETNTKGLNTSFNKDTIDWLIFAMTRLFISLTGWKIVLLQTYWFVVKKILYFVHIRLIIWNGLVIKIDCIVAPLKVETLQV